jgi:hypothetical protein
VGLILSQVSPLSPLPSPPLPCHVLILCSSCPLLPLGAGGYPCLVEVGSRCHGGEGTWIPVAQECVGFTQVSATVDIYTGGKFFHSIVDGNHYPLRKAGRDVDLVSRHSGIVRGFPGEALIRSLPSFRSLKWECKVLALLPHCPSHAAAPVAVSLTDSPFPFSPSLLLLLLLPPAISLLTLCSLVTLSTKPLIALLVLVAVNLSMNPRNRSLVAPSPSLPPSLSLARC